MSMKDYNRGESPIGFGHWHEPVKFSFPLKTLRAHTVVFGDPDTGKTTDSQLIAHQVQKAGCPVLIIDPDGNGYTQWAQEQNKLLPPDKRWEIYMPHADPLNEQGIKQLRLALFQAKLYEHRVYDPDWKIGYLSFVLADALALGDVGERIVHDVLEGVMCRALGTNPQRIPINQQGPMGEYPTLDELERFLDGALTHNTLSAEEQEWLCRTMHQRFKQVLRGSLAGVVRVLPSAEELELFQKPCIVNLSTLPDARDKRFVIALLLLAVAIYDVNSWMYGLVAYNTVGVEGLGRLVIVEDAHYLLSERPWEQEMVEQGCDLSNVFFDLLCELSHYGLGALFCDRTPSCLGKDIVRLAQLKVCHCLLDEQDVSFMAGFMGLADNEKVKLRELRFGEALVRVGDHRPIMIDTVV